MQALGLFTNRGMNRLLAEGGSQAWALRPDNARKMRYVVCFQNRDDGDWGAPTHEQGQAVLIGKISAVEPSPEGKPGRYIVRFDEYAELKDVRKRAKNWRNPVRYIDLEDYGIDPDALIFHPTPDLGTWEDEKKEREAVPRPTSLDMAGAKKALAVFYNVPVTAIEITIRG